MMIDGEVIADPSDLASKLEIESAGRAAGLRAKKRKGREMSETVLTGNGLEPAAIHPKRGYKYSPNLYRWLTDPEHKHRPHYYRVYRDKTGTLWIGMMDNGEFIGTKLISVLCNGRKEDTACWCNLGKLEEIEGFWHDYMANGRCAIDPEHSMHFVGDDTRWNESGDSRECQWCGNHTQIRHYWTETVNRSAWEPLGKESVNG